MIPFNALAPTRYGWMVYHALDQYVGQSIALYGEFSPDEADLLTSLVGPGDVVVDGGANIGALTLALAQAVGPTGIVAAFEPQRLTFHCLVANCALNSVTQVMPYQMALGRERGMLVCPPLDLHQVNNVGGLALGGAGTPNTTVVPLDDFHLPTVHLIKLDLEGMEGEALAGSTETIARCRPLLYVEADREEKRPALEAQLLDLGYRLYAHHPPLYSPDNFRGEQGNAFGEIVSINILAVPREDPLDYAAMYPGLVVIPAPEPVQEAA